MPRWCIAGFDGTINMQDNGDTRLWSLQSRDDMAAGPLVIVENAPYCSGRDEALKVSVDASASGQAEKGELLRTRFKLGTDGCTLEFRWPRTGSSDRSYIQTMLYGIMVGTSESNMRQLGPATNTLPSWQRQQASSDLGVKR
jgi:hypothetical protein